MSYKIGMLYKIYILQLPCDHPQHHTFHRWHRNIRPEQMPDPWKLDSEALLANSHASVTSLFASPQRATN